MKKASKNIIVAIAIGVLFLATASIFLGSKFDRGAKINHGIHKGMTFVSWTKDGYSRRKADESLEDVALLGVNWIALVTTWYQDDASSTRIYPIVAKTPSDTSLIHAIRKIHELHMKVMLKPHIDLKKSDGTWRGDIFIDDKELSSQWCDNYKKFILRYARIAQDNQAEIFCVGTELTMMAVERPEFFRELIADVRKVYKGKLTYAANWYGGYSEVEFWDALDLAGIDPYFPLSDKQKPDLAELVAAWGDWLPHLEAWQKEIGKPVIFTEIGYKSSTGSAVSPWEHMPGDKIDLQLQADCYEAFYKTFWDKPWVAGVYWWYWGTHPRMGGKNNRDFTPQNKPAKDIIAKWYNKS